VALSASDRRALGALRLTALGIAAPASGDASTIVRRLLALQAQDFAGAKWSIGLRGAGLTEADVDGAIARGEIVRSWPMRGTLHFTAPEDLRWMLAIAHERQGTWAAKRRGDLAISDDELERAAQVAVDELSGGRIARRDDLLAAFVAGGVPVDGQRAYHLLWNLGHRSLILFGPPDGKQPTFALLEEWITTHRDLERDEALAEFALRYFTGHGPATVRDFAWWASITLGQARIGLALVADRLEVRRFGDDDYWSAPGLVPAANGVHLLPGFDEYLLGYQDRSPVLAAEFADRIVPGNNGVFQPTIVVNTPVTGTWHRKDSAKQTAVELEWFMPPTARASEGVDRAAARFGRYLERPVVTR
jgi:hypothetical protein